jgi:hypothetical protein
MYRRLRLLEEGVMRIHVSDPTLVVDLHDYLARCNCLVETRGAHELEATPPPRPVESAYLQIELEGYLRVWRAMHPGTDVYLLDIAPV